ncbi:MAG: EthD family reductase, partial [Bacteroidota bacterium]
KIHFIIRLFSSDILETNQQGISMTKLIALYRKPSDVADFDKHYSEVHTPLVRQYPGLRRLEITRITGAPIGETKFHLMCEMYFDNKDAMGAALASNEGKAVARDLMSFAADVVTVFVGEEASQS